MTTTNPNAIVGRSEIAEALGFKSLATFDDWWRRARRLPGFPPPAPGYKTRYVLGAVLRFMQQGDRPAPPPLPTYDPQAAEDQQAIDYSRRMAEAAARIAQP